MSITEGLKRGTIELMLLTILCDSDMYGYQICQEFERRSKGLYCVPEGSLYPVLYRMLDKGYISDRKELVGKRRIRVYYHIENDGLDYLEVIKREYVSLNKGIVLALGYNNLEKLFNEDEKND